MPRPGRSFQRKPIPMSKFRWLQFWPEAYLKDTRHLSASARGIWMDLICHMYPAGEITGSVTTLARLCMVEDQELIDALYEIAEHEVAEVEAQPTVSNGKPKPLVTLYPRNANVTPDNKTITRKITVRSRRLTRLHNEREGNRKRQKTFRDKQKCNAPVTDNVTVQRKEERREKKEHHPSDDSAQARVDDDKTPSGIHSKTDSQKGSSERETLESWYPTAGLDKLSLQECRQILQNAPAPIADWKAYLTAANQKHVRTGPGPNGADREPDQPTRLIDRLPPREREALNFLHSNGFADPDIYRACIRQEITVDQILDMPEIKKRMAECNCTRDRVFGDNGKEKDNGSKENG